MIVATRLERAYSKDELLTLYLNTVPFSDNVFGIEVASKRFFNKAPNDLKLEEAATLIGTLKATTSYNRGPILKDQPPAGMW
jgi:penicillin-binding protein 1A